jgi:hypothetical protein
MALLLGQSGIIRRKEPAMRTRFTRTLSIAATVLLALPAFATDLPQQGVWKQHQVDFTFIGFTTSYSCDGLAEKLEKLLRAAGARADAKAIPGGCDRPVGPSRISNAHLTFYTLDSAPPQAEPAPTPPAPAAAPARQIGKSAPQLKKAAVPEPGVGAWKSVAWRAHSPFFLDPGDCELVEQFAHELLPLFETRKVEQHMTCVPNQIVLGGVQLNFDVLAALPPAEKPAARPAP